MQVILGLGNPGKKFRWTRHNIGKLFVDFLGRKGDFHPGSGPFYWQETVYGVLVIPTLWMNESGVVLYDIKKNFPLKIKN